MAAEPATIPVTSATEALIMAATTRGDSARGGDACGGAKPGGALREGLGELFFHAFSRDAFHQRQLDRLQEVAALAGEIGDRFRDAIFSLGSELRFDRVLQLRPETAQIGFEKLDRVLDLRLHGFAEFGFHFILEVVLPFRASPEQAPGFPKGELFFDQVLPVIRAVAAGALDAAEEAGYLPERLLMAHLDEVCARVRDVLRRAG